MTLDRATRNRPYPSRSLHAFHVQHPRDFVTCDIKRSLGFATIETFLEDVAQLREQNFLARDAEGIGLLHHPHLDLNLSMPI